ncbi:hypothetical protein BDR03DRAFT_947035 [Suillus americanus]|nr:hypothetical protein BDR03DRAFT_947035 [Suillus americanus]
MVANATSAVKMSESVRTEIQHTLLHLGVYEAHPFYAVFRIRVWLRRTFLWCNNLLLQG